MPARGVILHNGRRGGKRKFDEGYDAGAQHIHNISTGPRATPFPAKSLQKRAPIAKTAFSGGNCGRGTILRRRSIVDSIYLVFDGKGSSCIGVEFQQDCIHSDVALGDLKPRRQPVQKSLQHSLFVHADDGIDRSGHAHVGNEGGALR